MKELLRERDLTRISYYQSLLEVAGIATFVRNENLPVAEGVYFSPALCLVEAEDYEAAAELIRKDMSESPQGSNEELVCGKCGETSPGNFDRCWNCGTALA